MMWPLETSEQNQVVICNIVFFWFDSFFHSAKSQIDTCRFLKGSGKRVFLSLSLSVPLANHAWGYSFSLLFSAFVCQATVTRAMETLTFHTVILVEELQ